MNGKVVTVSKRLIRALRKHAEISLSSIKQNPEKAEEEIHMVIGVLSSLEKDNEQ